MKTRITPPAGRRAMLILVALCLAWASAEVCVGATPGSALQFDGAGSFVQVTNTPALNAFPLTATAWFRTTNTTAGIQGLLSKYVDGSGNGWFLIVQGGHLVGYYSAALGDQAIYATSAAVVADGFWHHAALTVDATGGKLYLDGVQVGSGTWGGSPGSPTGTQPLQIGRYYNNTPPLLGTMDEVTLWNRSLGIAEVNYLQHRQLNGSEDGLLALWHFDENGGPIAGDATGHGYIGKLVSNPVWIASSAPLVFNQVAGSALKFDGVNGYATVPNDTNFNSMPFTATAWFRTTNTQNVVQGIVSKYVDSGYNGWTLVVQNNHLRGFYYRSGVSTDFAIDATSAATVADGAWHHAALTVDTNGGKLFLDGVVVGQSTWGGPVGATTSAVPLQIGRYYNYAQKFQGDIDEVTIWNRALAVSEVPAFMNLPRAGNEPGLIACWHLNEGSGTNIMDATAFGHTGVLTNSPVWVGSTAFLGDGTSVIHTTLGAVQWTRQFAVKTIPGQSGFAASAPVWVRRLDDFGAPGGVTNVSVTLPVILQGAIAGTVPLPGTVTGFFAAMSPYLAAAPQATAGGVIQTPSLNVQPQTGVQLDSVNDTFQLGVTESYTINGGPAVTADSVTLAPTPLLHFDGNLFFGSLATVFTSIANTPTRGTPGGGGINTALAVNNNSGYVVTKPDHTYGNGALINAVLLSNGDAISSNSVSLAGPVPDTDCIQNICFQRTSLNLTPTGAVGFIAMTLPYGFSIGISPTNHLTVGALEYANTPLDANLRPVSASLVTAGPLYAVEETLPYWFAAPSATWLVNSGEILLNVAGGVFVRQQEDDLLTSVQATLVEPNAANRISNDGYFRNASAGSTLAVFADANGAARVTTSLTLNPPELRPHFPYAGSAPGNQIQTLSGSPLAILGNLIDPTNSHLYITAPVPVSYARDCEDATNCSSGLAGPANLAFAPTVSGQLGFTMDGGLLAYGSVPPTNLNWGFVSGTNFAETAGQVQNGAFCMAGTFLRGDQSALPAVQLPAAVLFSGFGDASNPNYLERPGDANYPNGFANYAGVNFRAPANGRSYLAKQDTGQYPLNPVSKYYARFGGINGIHQALTFPPSLTLYGYSFTFTSFGLSYLDSENWESRTDGAIAFPNQPAGFTQEFANLIITCRGDLGPAQIPSTSTGKHLNYWNADFKPLSMDFHPTNTDTCATSTRFLVLGVETKLPFIPNALHAALGFKPNGNLVTPADSVVNVDSRFPVPAQLSLQGPGTTFFTLSTAAKGYFNNWETAGRPDAGFYNLAGKLRVPFFSDIKAHLHVTPVSANSSSVNVMGGWPAADSAATDLGWSVNNSNFFNQASFDPHSDGWPVAQGIANITDYRKATTPDAKYHPRAQRDWIEVATFDYPLTWDDTLHKLQGFQTAKVILPVIDVDSRLKELAPGKVDFDFAQDISLQLPRIKVLDFVNDALNGSIGPLVTVSNAIRQELGAALNVTGINELSQTLREDAQGFFDSALTPVLNPLVDPLVNNSLFQQLAAFPQTNRAAFLSNAYNLITSPIGPLQSAIQNLNGVAGDANSVVGKLNKTLADVEDTAGLFSRVLSKDDSGNRHVVRTIVEKLAEDQGPAIGFASALDDGAINPLLTDLDPTLTEIQGDINDVSNQIAQVQAALGSVSGDFNQALSGILSDATGLGDFLKQAGTGVTNLLASSLTASGDYFTGDPAAVKQILRQQLETAFLASALPGNYQKTFRSFLYDKDFALNQLMDALFDQINRTIRDGLTSQIQGAQDGLLQNMKGAGLLGQSLLSAKIRGAPTFDGDSLRKIHLDAAIQLNVPDKMNFNAYMDIKELDSQSVPVDCIPAGAPAAEVTLGCKDVPLSWAGVSADSGSKLTLGVEARWTLQGGAVKGIGGLVDIKGGANFEGCSIKEIAAQLAIGETENYFAAKAAGSVLVLVVPVDVQAGIFVGHCCSLGPLKWIDPEADQVLNNPANFSGLYVEYGGGVSLSEILLGTSTCLLDVEAGITTALYYQGGPSLGTVGGRQKVSLDASLLCVLSGHADWSEFMSVSGTGQLTVGGSANVCGSIGPCPFCISGCKGITVKGVLTTGGINYYIDY